MEEEILNDEGDIDYDKLRNMEKKGIQPLPMVDHTQVEYETFDKEFYQEHEDITNMSADIINAFRRKHAIRVEGERVPRPLMSFDQLLVDEWI